MDNTTEQHTTEPLYKLDASKAILSTQSTDEHPEDEKTNGSENTIEQHLAETNYCPNNLEEVQSAERKEYKFFSGRHLTWSGMRIVYTINIEADRLTMDTFPKRFNKCPVIMFRDICSVDISIKIPVYTMIFMAISIFVALFESFLFILVALLFLYGGLNRKITISQRNGMKAVIYTKDKAMAMNFKEDIEKIIKNAL